MNNLTVRVIRKRKKSYSDSSMRQYKLSILNSLFFNWCVEKGYIDASLVDESDRVDISNKSIVNKNLK